MSWERLSLFTNVTRPPRVTVTEAGLTAPLAPIVMVADAVGGVVAGGVVVVGGVVAGGVVVVGVGVVGGLELPPPHAAAEAATMANTPSPIQIDVFMLVNP